MTLKTLLTIQELEEMGIAKRTKIYYMMKQGDFPKPLKYDRTNRWAREDVQAWLDKQNPNRKQEAQHGGLTA
jgi:hypothetical protein